MESGRKKDGKEVFKTPVHPSSFVSRAVGPQQCLPTPTYPLPLSTAYSNYSNYSNYSPLLAHSSGGGTQQQQWHTAAAAPAAAARSCRKRVEREVLRDTGWHGCVPRMVRLPVTVRDGKWKEEGR
eukprot:COSAG02_NODE_8969_length_2378_cov_7.781044_3_plen_125_part_00